MKQSDQIVLRKMISYCEDIETLLKRYEYDYEKYCNDISFQYSCNMCILQIGELVTRLSNEIIENNKHIPWKPIKGMRNLHAHDYENVDLEIVWNTLNKDIPDLKENLKKILESFHTDTQ